jgi:Mg2+ and Co2+ transporter CorA
MNDEQVIDFMVNAINDANRLLCEQIGMDQEQIDKQIEQSTQSINMIVTLVHARMKSANLLA